jgi:hypothetical protein
MRPVAEWEYRKLFLNLHPPRGDELDALNAAGAEGWELIGITGNNVAYLKREVDEVALPTTAHVQQATANGNRASPGGAQEAIVKYRDPVTRETWSGRGRMPNWLKRKQEAGEDIDEYLV